MTNNYEHIDPKAYMNKLDLGDDEVLFPDEEVTDSIPDIQEDSEPDSSETEHTENIPEESLDKSEKSATLNSNADDFEAYLESLPTERDREFAREAKQMGWSHKKYATGKGKSAEVWIATAPYIQMNKEYQEKIKELTNLIYSSNKVTAKTLQGQKETAEEIYAQAEERLVHAKEAGDVEEMQAAYTDMQRVKKISEQLDDQLNDLQAGTPKVAPEVSKEQMAAIRQHADDFLIENYEWAHPDSPTFDREKFNKAMEIEQSLLIKDPNINPKLLYKRVALELRNSSESNETVKEPSSKSPPPARKAAIESTSGVRSYDHRSTKTITTTDKHILDALKSLNKSHGNKFMSPQDYLKKYGKK